MSAATLTAERIEVHGVVQGVGFRPFVHGLAVELGLRGHVGNDAAKVFIEVAGPGSAVERFVARLSADAPPLARIDRVVRCACEPEAVDRRGFRIVASRAAAGPRTLVPPDTALCGDCLAELFDPDDRRHRHPFITCTNCGPRFTIITGVPYDRPATTMARFPMCGACAREYGDPSDRRYHAQPVCCPDCGPTLTFHSDADLDLDLDPITAAVDADDPIVAAAASIGRGAVVAIKGLGGYHLAVDAASDPAVAELRRRKQRPDKPFAVMVADLDQAGMLADVDPAEATLLTSPAAPIVLLRARADSPLSPLVAPANPLIGVMVAYTPVHHLLLAAVGRPLVMTSANRGGEPIAWTADRLAGLDDLIDATLDHDRPIHQPCDDSVVRVVGGRLLPIRRARGYAPLPVTLPPEPTRSAPAATGGGRARPQVLAVGAELKNTGCVLADGQAWVSQHIGDMENLETLAAFETSLAHYQELYGVTPDRVAADAHPAYLSSRWARRHVGADRGRLVEVQHHHAHVAAVLAEHQVPPATPVIGVAFDGTGYGLDGTIWGGEVLVASATGFERVAHLAPVPLPGGDAAIREPARAALAHLHAAGIDWSDDLPPVAHLAGDGTGPRPLDLLRRQLDRGVGCVPTTSMGRLFDAVASLAGLRHRISFEAQAAIDLEIAAAATGPDPLAATDDGYRFDIAGSTADPAPVLRAIVADRAAGVPVPVVARRFHLAVVALVVRIAIGLRDEHGLETVALSGGVFQNALLSELSSSALEAEGFRVLTHALVPANDGGLALGQAWIAANHPTGPPA